MLYLIGPGSSRVNSFGLIGDWTPNSSHYFVRFRSRRKPRSRGLERTSYRWRCSLS